MAVPGVVRGQQNALVLEVLDDALDLPPRPEREQFFHGAQAVVRPVTAFVIVPVVGGILFDPELQARDKNRTVHAVHLSHSTVKMEIHVSTFPSFRLSLSIMLALYMSMFWRR